MVKSPKCTDISPLQFKIIIKKKREHLIQLEILLKI